MKHRRLQVVRDPPVISQKQKLVSSGTSQPLLAQEAEALHAEVQILQAEAGQLRRDNELKTEMEAQCARRGVTQVGSTSSRPSLQQCNWEHEKCPAQQPAYAQPVCSNSMS